MARSAELMAQAALRAVPEPGREVTHVTLARRTVAEALGTAFLVATVIGSGIMAERLAGGNVALALLANTLATGAALVALILALGPVSGAHLNPAVTLTSDLSWRESLGYMSAQVAGGLMGAVVANAMFALPLVSMSAHTRSGASLLLSEFVATFGLVMVIETCARKTPDAVAFAVAAYITAAYWFTASTSFANPAVTIARALSDTFAGIRAADVPGFVIAQIVGALAAARLVRWLVPR
jgi:glycerol uptake facilitator-like aquaporin